MSTARRLALGCLFGAAVLAAAAAVEAYLTGKVIEKNGVDW